LCLIFINGERVETFVFPGGECSVKVNVSGQITKLQKRYGSFGPMNDMVMDAWLYSAEDIMHLMLSMDAAYRGEVKEIHLRIPYLPYARQDRVCNKGEAFSLKVIATMINSYCPASVTLFDPHSLVSQALINNVHVRDTLESCLFFNNPILKHSLFQTHSDNFVIIAPDEGARKRARRFAGSAYVTETTPIIQAIKNRGPKGNIIETEVYGDVQGKDALIVDDICDGGRTFIELAKVLKEKGAKDLYLYVTHGIFSNGTEELKKYFVNVFAGHCMLDLPEEDYSFVITDNRRKN